MYPHAPISKKPPLPEFFPQLFSIDLFPHPIIHYIELFSTFSYSLAVKILCSNYGIPDYGPCNLLVRKV
jgi:hypothetical protein